MSLDVTRLSYAYGSKQALDDISFSVDSSRFCALLGPNGAGKSTLFNLLTRLFTTRDGRILIGGQDLSRQPRQALAQLGVVFQQQTLDLDLTVIQNLAYFAALQGLSGKDARRRCDAAMARLDITDRARIRAGDLNGGHRRRLEIARALLHDPSVLLLDEPTVGLDAASRSALTDHVHDLARNEGLTVLWATHLTDEIRDDDQILLLHQGRIRAQGLTREVTDGQPLRETFLRLTRAEAAS